MKNSVIKTAFLFVIGLLISSSMTFAQTIDEETLIGEWEIEGTLMGDDGEGWLAPHKQSAPDCGEDHTVFAEDHTAKEVKYAESCDTKENEFKWKLDGDTLILSKGERSVTWHILSLEDGTLKIGVQMRADSDNRMYVVYKRRE